MIGDHNTQINYLPSVLVSWRGVRRWLLTARPSLDEQTNVLATAMRNQWQQAALERRLLEPAPLPIRWSRSTRPVAGPPAAATTTGDGQPRFDPLPGLVGVTTTQLRKGDRHALHSIYGGLDSGRLVIVGAAGSGKSAAAILLLCCSPAPANSSTPPNRPTWSAP